MALIWSDSVYGTGVPEIDEQHQELFRQINALLEQSVLGNNKEEIARLLMFLDRYILTHFKYEEAIMEKRSCSTCAANKNAHMRFIKDFAILKNRFKHDGASPAFVVDVQRLLVDWLSNHIMKIDVPLRETTNLIRTKH